MIHVRAITPDDWKIFRRLRLNALREAPYAFGTRLAEWQGAGDTEARWRQRLTDVPFNVVAYLDRNAAGIVSATHPNDEHTTELISMWVEPFARGCGAGDALVAAVATWARERHARRVRLAVKRMNRHAIALYARNGFSYAGEEDDECIMELWLDGPPSTPPKIHHGALHVPVQGLMLSVEIVARATAMRENGSGIISPSTHARMRSS